MMRFNVPASVREAAKKTKSLLLDVDGVMTDGCLYYSDSGEEMKAFNTQDGLGITMLQKVGIQVGIITGRRSALLKRRADELSMWPVVQGCQDKLTALYEFLPEMKVDLDEIAYVGDDLPDLPIIRRVGLGIVPANSSCLLADQAHWQTKTCGGDGAVREVAELILEAQDKLEPILASYQ